MGARGYVVRGTDKRGNVVTGDGITTTDAAVRAMRLLEWGHCTDVAIFRVHDDGREERLPSYEEALTLLGADPLAALEAAERRLLEAGGWREIEPGGRWYHPVIGHRWKGAALADEKSRRRERLAAKGGA